MNKLFILRNDTHTQSLATFLKQNWRAMAQAGKPLAVAVSEYEPDKTPAQRNKFHALCTDISREVGLTPGQVKNAVKQEYYGIDEFKFGNKWVRGIKSTEDSKRRDYSALIEATYRFAAEAGVHIPDEGTS